MQTLCFCFVESADQKFENLETRTGQVEDQVHNLTGNFEITIVVNNYSLNRGEYWLNIYRATKWRGKYS